MNSAVEARQGRQKIGDAAAGRCEVRTVAEQRYEVNGYAAVMTTVTTLVAMAEELG